jgi:uncharacterized protein
MSTFPLAVWPGRWAICRLAASDAVPAWATASASPLQVVARTATELSIVAPEAEVPKTVVAEDGFRVIAVVGPVPFAVTGLMASLATALAAAGVSLVAIGTYDTDYVLVKEEVLANAVAALRAAGFEIS